MRPQVASLFGCSANTFYDQLNSEDKALKKAAKAKAKEINAFFNQLDGCFELGIGPQGLAVYGVPSGPSQSQQLEQGVR